MKKAIKVFSLFFFALLLAGSVQAQKFGYLDSNAILADMAEVKEMRSKLESLKTQLQKQGQQMIAEYQTQEQEYVKKKERGELSRIQDEEEIGKLQKKQEEILTAEKEMQDKLLAKENELLEPILKKVNDAIQAVAKEGGYQFIFDAGVLLYADEGTDVSSAVKAKISM
jgi:outer membrane protein